MFSIAGGHWVVLQTVAWAQMLKDYSRQTSFAEAAKKTFSGDHPCALCKKVAEGRKNEGKVPATGKADKKFEVFIANIGKLLKHPDWRYYAYPRFCDALFASRSDSPPSPVPISALG